MLSKKTLFIFVSLTLISILGVYYKNVNSDINTGLACDLTLEKCTFFDAEGLITVKFISPIITEEEILLDIQFPKTLKLQRGWIEGVNMYMGKTPIIRQDERYLTFLGSCNLAKMEWKLNLLFENKNGQVFNYSAIFYTSLE